MRRSTLFGLIALAFLAVNNLWAQPTSPAAASPPPGTNAIVLPAPLRDPLEPFNRAVWSLNVGALTSVIQPAAKGYRFVVPRPVRRGIGNAGRNLAYPGRLLNFLLQGNWPAADSETKRLVYNTFLGLGGFFDVATREGVPKRDTDFGQTFQSWGWHPGIFLMLPLLGPSDVRDSSGLVGDYAANPLNYFFPYEYIGAGVMANNTSDSVNEAVRFSQAQADPYSILKYAWTYSHDNRKADMSVHGSQDAALLETLQSTFFSYKNPEFLSRAKTRSVLIPATGKKLDFTCWLQPRRAPIVYLIPGFGGHRLDASVLGLAEVLVSNRFSVVTVSSPFHPEFMEHASTTALPAYPPIGINDLHVALTQIDAGMEAAYPGRLGARAIMGSSMGAFQSLFMAATEAENTNALIHFERYVAIDSPVNLRYAVTNLDRYYQAPMAWPEAEREANIRNTLLKVAALVTQPGNGRAQLPFNTIESEFLIGFAFHFTLRDIIFSSQLRHNLGVLQQPVVKSRREAVYNEILKYSFRNYIDDFAMPYDRALGIDLNDPKVIEFGTSLKAHTAELAANPNVRVILNRNDLLLDTDDLAWMEATFPVARVTEFPDGGHVGNLWQPAVQRAIVQALDGLGAEPSGR